MSASLAPAVRPSRRLGAPAAVVAGLIANVVVTLAIDQLLHVLGVFPPWGTPDADASDFALALGYRIVIGIAGGWLVARLARRSPMRCALAYGGIGVVMSLAGAIAAAAHPELGPAWYPWALVFVAMPCAWAGGRLVEARRAEVRRA